MRRIVPLFLLVVLLGSLHAGVRADTAITPGDFMGMVVRDPHYEWKTNPTLFPNTVNQTFYDAVGKNLEAAGVKWVRFEFRAEDKVSYDPNNPSQGLRFSNYDYFINIVAPAHHLKVIGLLATNLVRDVSYIDPEEIERTGSDYEVTNCYYYKYGCGTNPYMRIWLDRAFAIADRYQDKISAYEVMNEENRYIAGDGKGISPTPMATLLTKFYRVFKVTGPKAPTGPGFLGYPVWRPNVKLILGGIHPNRCDDCRTSAGTSMTDREYLDAIYKSSPVQAFRASYPTIGFPLDGVGYHPYPMEMRYGIVPEPTGYDDLFRVPSRMLAMRDVMVSNGDKQHKIWVTEVGDRGTPIDPDNLQRQANFLITIYRMLWQQRDFVETVLWFKYEDFAVPSDPNSVGSENWGVVRLNPCTPNDVRPSCSYYTPDGKAHTYEYAVDGSVQTFKPSYSTYYLLTTCGMDFERCRKVYVPLVMR